MSSKCPYEHYAGANLQINTHYNENFSAKTMPFLTLDGIIHAYDNKLLNLWKHLVKS